MNFKLISHRGNTTGADLDTENNPEHINNVVKDYDCEIDLRYREKDSQFFLGHNDYQYKIDFDWLISLKDRLWIHCKDFNSLNILSEETNDLNFFWHDSDDFTLTSKGIIWTYPGKEIGNNSVIVIKDLNEINKNCYGICSDSVEIIEKKYL